MPSEKHLALSELKIQVHKACREQLKQSLSNLDRALRDSREALSAEAKSTAGDKHETGRAMVQLEMEKLGGQLLQAERQLNLVKRLRPDERCQQFKPGALAKIAGSQYYFLGPALGEIKVEGKTIYALSVASPLAQAMLGKKAGDSFTFRGKVMQVQELV